MAQNKHMEVVTGPEKFLRIHGQRTQNTHGFGQVLTQKWEQ